MVSLDSHFDFVATARIAAAPYLVHCIEVTFITRIMKVIEQNSFVNTVHELARMLHERNEDQGKYGKQYWSIARRCIAIAMDQGGSIKIAYREVAGGAPSVRRPGGRATQELLAESSQIFPEFVQAHTVIFDHVSIPG